MAIFTQNPDYTAKIVNANQTVVGESYKMSQVIADFNAIGIDCDSVIMHDWRSSGYGAFIPLKITEQGTYYVGDNDLKSGLGTNATLWQKSNTVWGGHYYRYVNGVPTDYGALSLGSQTVDDIEYWYDYDGNVSYIPLFYLDSSITVVINNVPVPPSTKVTSNGGGATHIAKVTGQLKDLSSNLSDILIVSGGGGGGLLVGETDYSGKEAGGISGSGDNSGDQSTGNAFGLGESGTNVSGGGSGLYGGYKGTSSKSGGAGSGYIGNSLLSNKKMVGYNVPTSSAEGTKTESVNVYSATKEANKPKAGNGFARIKFLRNNDWRCLTSIEVNGTNCPLLQINDFSIIPNTYGGSATLIRRQSGIYIPSGVSDLGSEFAQPTISSGTVEKSTNYNDVILRTTFGYSAQAYSNFNDNEIIYNTNTVLMSHSFLLATEANTRLYIGIALNDAEEYGCCYFVAQYPDRNWTTENYSGGDGEIGYLIYSIFGNS